MALDISNERVYWTDHDNKNIVSIDYNGNDWRTILHFDTDRNKKRPYSLTIFEEKLYWGCWSGVFVMNKFNGTEVRKVKLFFFYSVIYLIDLLRSQAHEFLTMLQRKRMVILLSYGRYRHKDSFFGCKNGDLLWGIDAGTPL